MGRSTGQRLRPFDLLVYGVVLSYVWRIQDLYPVLATLKYPVLVSLAALGFFFVKGHATRVLRRIQHPILSAATFLLFWMVVSVPGSVYQGLSFRFVLDDHIKTFLMMLMVVATIRSVVGLQRVLLVQVIGATLYCVLILTRFEVGPGGRLGNLYFYDANDLAMLIVATLPLAVYFLRSSARPLHRLLALTAVGLFAMAIVKTGSRGGFLGLIAVTTYLVIGFNAIPFRVRAGGVVGAAIVLFTVAGPQYWNMMETMLNPTADYNWAGNADSGRMAVWSRGIGYMLDRPITGVGVSAFPVAEGTISPLAERQQYGIGLKWSAAHNSFVQIGAELGVPGLIAFVLLLFKALTIAWRPLPDGGVARDACAPIGQALTGAIIGYIVAGFFLSQAYAPFLYTTLACVVGLSYVARLSRVSTTPQRKATTPATPLRSLQDQRMLLPTRSFS